MTLNAIASCFDASQDKIASLVRYYQNNRTPYESGIYNEAQVRQNLIDPLFIALGWDVHNEGRAAPQYAPVIVEPSLDVEGQKKSPDYAFRIGPQTKFYTEAKKVGVAIRNDPAPAYQLRRYAWSAKLPLSLLTDFQEIAVYDCRFRPANTDKSSAARINYYTCEEYPDRWRELWDVFSYPAVLGGSFDQFAQAEKGKRGTSEVDDEFLKEIEQWREDLARNIALRNGSLSVEELNDAVQRTIDRVIFLRMAEDRGIEEYEQLQRMAQHDGVYPELVRLFRRADTKYNSGLFDMSSDAGRWTTKLTVDDKVLRGILSRLYFPQSPYEFSVLPVATLGDVYEQFLGKVIRLTPAHQAKVEEKPEVAKSGGVKYTPSYIVAAIVRRALGSLVEGKSPKQLARLYVLDMACGSGSFLLEVYQFLLDYYLRWYTEHDPQRYPQAVWQQDGVLKLTVAEKKRILTTHVFGVDIDRQAVEVTKLSLLLKVLEGEDDETLGKQLPLFQEQALPNLEKNIKCGNSLVGPDYFAGRMVLDPDEMRRVNPFDWQVAFPEVMAHGGFSCIVGNPPYIRIQVMKEWAPLEVEIYKELYKTAGSGNYDIYVTFVEKGLSLLNKDGRLGFILPNKFLNAQYGEPLRHLIAQGKYLSGVVHFGDQQVFRGATTYTCLMFLNKAGSDSCWFTKVSDLIQWRNSGAALEGSVPAASIASAEWNFVVGGAKVLFKKLHGMSPKLGDVADIYVGLQTSADDVFIMSKVDETPQTIRLYSNALEAERTLEKGLMHPLVSGTDVNRYGELPQRQYILFPYQVTDEEAQLLSFEDIQKQYPETAAYLIENKKRLEGRERGKFKGHGWHRFGRNQNIGIQDRVKLCVPRLVDRLYAAYDARGDHLLDNVDVGGVTFKEGFGCQQFEYILGLLNSKLLRWYFPFVSAPFRGGYLSANRQFLSQLPIRIIDFGDPTDKARHDRMVALVSQMLELHKYLHAAPSNHEHELYQRQIDAADKQIDALVYELYGLSNDEIRLVEGTRLQEQS
jgi:hypothetical protein